MQCIIRTLTIIGVTLLEGTRQKSGQWQAELRCLVVAPPSPCTFLADRVNKVHLLKAWFVFHLKELLNLC